MGESNRSVRLWKARCGAVRVLSAQGEPFARFGRVQSHIKTKDAARDVTSCVSQKCHSEVSIRIAQCCSEVSVTSLARKCLLEARAEVLFRSVEQMRRSATSVRNVDRKCCSDVLNRRIGGAIRSVAQKSPTTLVKSHGTYKLLMQLISYL